ncbi:signal peptidase I [Paenibacillus sp. KN14-4R]|uniref:signal peptidase I n=1 Tax=Paenibacillus sp. KN14-4R TaxID=3445773 RepID=UPI003FA0C59E
MKKVIKQWIPSIFLAIVISLFIRTYVAEAMSVPTGSMIPTIQVNDRLIVEKMMWMTNLNFGDIIVFYPPLIGEENTRYVKRLIGLPGDLIEIKDGKLFRNNEQITETYINEPMTYTYGPVKVPDHNYFFLGDNRNSSFDSHAWQTPFVAIDKIIGKVILDIPTHLLFK